MKAFKAILIALPILFILWIVGLFNGLKLTPNFHEDFYIGDHGLDRRMALMQPEEELTLEMDGVERDTVVVILDLFPSDSVHKLTINKLKGSIIANNTKLDTIWHYVYSSFGQEKSLATITNFPVGTFDSVATYVEARYVYDLIGVKKFTLEIEADYLYDNVPRAFNKSFEVVHTRKLRWQGLNFGAHH